MIVEILVGILVMAALVGIGWTLVKDWKADHNDPTQH